MANSAARRHRYADVARLYIQSVQLVGVEKALTAIYAGSHNLLVANTHNSWDYPSRTLARLFFPDVTIWKEPVNGSESLVNVSRAREIIGFESQHSLIEYLNGEHDAQDR